MKLLKNGIKRLRYSGIVISALFPLLLFISAFQLPVVDDTTTSIDIAISSTSPVNSPSYVGCGGQIAPVVNAQYEQRILELVNDQRESAGLPPLKRTTQLDDTARYHATDMRQDNYFNHNSYDRSGANLTLVCNWDQRLSSFYTNWNTIGENIAAGYGTPEAAMTGWMNSAGHRANILNSSYWEIGIGYSEGGGDYYRYYVQNFGRRNNVYPLLINQDDASTTNPTVSLYIYGSWTQIRLRNDDLPWSTWMSFQNQMSWTLPSTTGNHQVSVELTKPSSSATSTDMIYLDLPDQPELGNLPDSIAFTYSIPGQLLIPGAAEVTPQNTGSSDPLEWSVSKSGNWFSVEPSTGTTPQSFTITPSQFITDTVGSNAGTITVTIPSPPGVTGSPRTIDITLEVLSSLTWTTYAPLVVK